MTKPAPTTSSPSSYLHDPQILAKRHLRFGWWALLVFLVLGLALEILHGFKVPFYLRASNETRRLMWTLAHAHGTLFSLINIGFALTVRLLPEWAARERGIASNCLRGATVLMPAGFFFGGIRIYAGDPGLGIVLVPPGGVLLLISVFLTACGVGTIRPEMRGSDRPGTTSITRRR